MCSRCILNPEDVCLYGTCLGFALVAPRGSMIAGHSTDQEEKDMKELLLTVDLGNT